MPDQEDQEHAPRKGKGGRERDLPAEDDAIDGDLLETSWDDDDGDDDDEAAFARAFGGPDQDGAGSRTVWVVGAAVLVVVVLVGALLIGGKDSKKNSANPPVTTGTPTGSGGTTPGSTTPKSRSAQWPAAVVGRPTALGVVKDGVDKVKPGTPPGAYLWTDFGGWHLWIVRGTGVSKVKGSITSNDKVARATAVGAPVSTVTKSGTVINFDFTSATAPVVGIDLNPGFFAKALIVILDGPNGPVDPKLIFQGQKLAPVAKNPFPVERVTPS